MPDVDWFTLHACVCFPWVKRFRFLDIQFLRCVSLPFCRLCYEAEHPVNPQCATRISSLPLCPMAPRVAGHARFFTQRTKGASESLVNLGGTWGLLKSEAPKARQTLRFPAYVCAGRVVCQPRMVSAVVSKVARFQRFSSTHGRLPEVQA